MNYFLNANTPLMRTARTIAEGIVSYLIANIDYLVGLRFSGETKAMIITVSMAILTYVLALFKKEDDLG